MDFSTRNLCENRSGGRKAARLSVKFEGFLLTLYCFSHFGPFSGGGGTKINGQNVYRHLSGKKKAHKHKLFGPVALGTPRECPGDKPGLSPGQSGFVPGTNPGFLLTLHSGSPECPWDKPSLSQGHSGYEGRQKEFMR